VRDLSFLNEILEEIKHNEEAFGSHTATRLALERCVESLDALSSIARSLHPGFVSSSKIKRKWTALEAVMKSDKIVQFKAKLQEAKLNLILAQQSSAAYVEARSTVAVMTDFGHCRRVHHQNHQVHQQSFQVLTERLSSLQAKASDPSWEIDSPFQENGGITGTLSPECYLPSTSSLLKPIQHKIESELSLVVRSAVARALQHQAASPSLATQQTCSAPDISFPYRTRQRRRLVSLERSITATGFGDLRFSVASYRRPELSATNSDQDNGLDDGVLHEEHEVETSLIFMPSWWVSKCGSPSLHIDVSKLPYQGWQTGIRAFNVRNLALEFSSLDSSG